MEVCVGHIVVPRNEADSSNSNTDASTEPTVKKPRVEHREHQNATACHQQSPHFLQVAELTEESLRDALQLYALQSLKDSLASPQRRSDDEEGVPASKARVLEAVEALTTASSPQWPLVVPPQPSTSRTSWVTWSFCFVPHVRNDPQKNTAQTSNDGACSADTCAAVTLEDAARAALAAIPLPRSVRIGGAAARGCTTAVLVERVSLESHKSTSPNNAASSFSAGSDIPQRSSSMPSLSPAVRSKPLLLVGAGGIGCEVLKVLVLSGFTHIHLLDLDTIDATNLNRQFLFQLPDVGASKAETARRVVLEWFDAQTDAERATPAGQRRPAPHIVAYHDNIKAEKFDDAFYQPFAAVLNALDNVSARQHVNRMCMRNNIPLIESGTMGYNGQVQPIVKGQYECYDCRPKPPDTKTFAVCTIHARPTTMVHCVHYAKELYEVLFGSTAHDATPAAVEGSLEEAVANTDVTSPVSEQDAVAATATGSDGQEGELSYLRTLVTDWRRGQQQGNHLGDDTDATRGAAGAVESSKSAATTLGARLLCQLFIDKVEELLSLKSSWSTEPPVPLLRCDVEAAVASYTAARAASALRPLSSDEVLPLVDSVELFARAVDECLSRPPGAAFKKEDDVAVRFVAATANLRAHIFHIAPQSLEEVRSIAGSIVPAIATTNAIIAAAVVHELQALLLSTTTPTGMNCVEGGVEGKGEKGENNSIDEENETAVTPRVVYARKAPQLRRRRLSAMSIDATHFISPSLYTTLENDRTAATPLRTGSAPAPAMKPRCVTDAYLVHSTCPNPPNSLHCLVCQDVHPEVVVRLNLHTVTLGQLVHEVLENALELEGPSVSHGATMLYEDEDYEVLAENSLAQLLQPAQSQGASQGEAATSATQVAAKPHRFVLTADALNKDVAWSIVLIDSATVSENATSSTTVTDNSPNGVPNSAEVQFALFGVKQARRAEQHALARRSEHQRLEQLEADQKSKDSKGGTAHEEEGVSSQPAEVVISDDDVSDVEEVLQAGHDAAKQTSVTPAGENEEEGDDEVIVLDD